MTDVTLAKPRHFIFYYRNPDDILTACAFNDQHCSPEFLHPVSAEDEVRMLAQLDGPTKLLVAPHFGKAHETDFIARVDVCESFDESYITGVEFIADLMASADIHTALFRIYTEKYLAEQTTTGHPLGPTIESDSETK